ncbi:MAG: GH36-type glycosyl hydrolase domain-containing protein [Anaerocolumna sp.]
MILNTTSAPIALRNGNSSFTFLSGGDSFEWIHESTMINSFRGNTLNGSANNIYLRIYKNDTLTFYPLIGLSSKSSLKAGDSSLVFEGTADQISYTVTFRLTSYGIWFWDISLKGQCDKVDLIYSQDIGIGSKGSVNTNELYVAQYLGHSVYEGEYGYVICSRQNMPQGESNPYLQQGSLGIRSIGYSTDGTQFFGLSYKKTDIPNALFGNLPNVNKQYELSHAALQTEAFSLNGEKKFSFYGICKSNHPEAIKEIEYINELQTAYTAALDQELTPVKVPSLTKTGPTFASKQWSAEQVNEYFPHRLLEEKVDNTLHSFFTPAKGHVVLQSKELITERPHGHILLTNFDLTKVPQGLVSSTNYIYGVFNCQLVVGNTTYNKLLSNHRGLLNVEKHSGQRIYVKMGDSYRLLTLPAAYEMDVAGSTWYYQLEDDVLIVTSFAMYNRPEIVLKVKSVNHIKYDFIVTHQLTAGPNEYENEIILTKEDNIITIHPSPEVITNTYYPDLHFSMKIPVNSTITDDSFFFEDNTTLNPTLLSVLVPDSSDFDIVIQGYDSNNNVSFLSSYDYEVQQKAYYEYYDNLTCNFELRDPSGVSVTTQKLNTIVHWYTHDALIHFASPHGLEQSGGAAWGTRDVCQGPLEFFLTTQNYSLVRDILLTLFSHQIDKVFEWPQWFMFDRYPMHQEDCHGDVVFWPLKAISDYIQTTGDISILEEVIDYRTAKGALPINKPETILLHIKRAVDTIKNRYLPGTALISYAGGDWDDTLQPANGKLKENLVSAWTQSLAMQTLELLSISVLNTDKVFAKDVSQMATEIKDSFYKYLIKDGVIAGFLYRESEDYMKYMLHPTDTETSIQYRLLPLTRSIIAQLADSELAARNMDIIDEHLSCPDGVRLMDHPASYNGGISKIFLRAEQAANVGREISLQYSHAHIRYIEAAATLGLSTKAWDALMRINPILLTEYVPNALTRQSNVYFSSSEGVFNDRYEYAANFDKLRTGDISVKGGWRLYSSGPGIYIRRIVADLFGIRFKNNKILIDPVITKDLDGVALQYTSYEKTVTFIYHIDNNMDQSICIKSNNKTLPGSFIMNPYRHGGFEILKEDFLKAAKENREFHIYLK